MKAIMSECMEADKPEISILMAVYEPNMDWLSQQLLSLNGQTYPRLRLFLRDDCSPTVPFEAIRALVSECITAFPYTIERNEQNLGSNETFARLTAEGEGAYFAYCDQDDIWFPHRISMGYARLQETGARLCCGDTVVIDATGKQVAGSICAVRPHHVFAEGEGLAGTLLFRNFVIGCTMLVERAQAQKCLPFAKTMVHDHFLALMTSLEGRIAVCHTPLIQYRIHGGNQTGILSGVTDKESYYQRQLHPFTLRMEELRSRMSHPDLDRAVAWAKGREAHFFHQRGGLSPLWQGRTLNRNTTLFELVALRLPKGIFARLVKKIQQGKL